MRTRVLMVGFVVAAALSLSSVCGATPEAATWHRDVLLGESRERFVVLRTSRSQPGSYYTYDECLAVLEFEKPSRRLVEADTLWSRTCNQDLESRRWSCEPDSLAPAQIAAHLAGPGFSVAFATDWDDAFQLDSGGVYVEEPEGRIRLLAADEVRLQVPAFDTEDHERHGVAGVEITNLDDPESGQGYFYLRIRSGSPAMDSDWAEDLVLVPAEKVAAAYRRLGELRERGRKR